MLAIRMFDLMDIWGDGIVLVCEQGEISMARFKVGDRVRVVSGHNDGEEGVIDRIGYGKGISFCDYSVYISSDPDPVDKIWGCDDEELEPLIELGSWGEIEKAIKWNPTKKKESVK